MQIEYYENVIEKRNISIANRIVNIRRNALIVIGADHINGIEKLLKKNNFEVQTILLNASPPD